MTGPALGCDAAGAMQKLTTPEKIVGVLVVLFVGLAASVASFEISDRQQTEAFTQGYTKGLESCRGGQ